MINLKLAGIVDNNYLQWKQNLIQALTDVALEYELEEINKVDEIVSLGSSTIPALWINDDLVLEQNGHTPQYPEMKKLFINYLKSEEWTGE